MQLFRNRADLKKAYGDLKEEFHRLKDRIKQQEGATIRVQELLDALGDLLADAATGFAALVFYQLRGLWKTGHQQLIAVRRGSDPPAGGARDGARTWRECEIASEFALADVDSSACRRRCRCRPAARAPGRARRTSCTRLTRFWHYFKRRRAQKSLEALQQGVVAARCGRRRAARGAQRHRQRGAAGVSRALARSPAHHQSRDHQLRRIAVRARGRVRARGARQGGRGAARSRDELRHARRTARATCSVCRRRRLPSRIRSRSPRASGRKLRAATRATSEYRNSARYRADGGLAGGCDRRGTPPSWNVLAEDYWDLYNLLLR